MAKVCQICERRAKSGNTRSHSRVATKRTMGINLQSKKIGGNKILICTSCIRTLNKMKKKTTIKK
ncbi:50S ribosomal protein L28 [bacterium]|nr:50S ribosomal protein L28 [bacterium]